MKKTIISKFISNSIRKIKHSKGQVTKFRLADYQEDFVITEQEEREGGYFGRLNFKPATSYK